MTDSVLKQMENYCYTSFKREHEYSDAFGGLVSAGVQNQGRYGEYVHLFFYSCCILRICKLIY